VETSFKSFCDFVERIANTRGNNAKIALCVQFLQSITTTEELEITTQFLSEGAFSNVSGIRASVGHRTLATLAADFCEIDYDLVFKPCKTATGSSSETIQRLFENIPEARNKWSDGGLTLGAIAEVYSRLANTRKRVEKQRIIWDTWNQITPLEVKYFIRILGQGSLRIGFESKSLLHAIAKAFDANLDQVRYAHMISGSMGKTAVLARESKLDTAQFKMFSPIAFMLASPIESRSVEDFSAYIAEEKFDGMRCQAHIQDNEVRLYSRDLNEISHSFPEVISFFEDKQLPPTVLDGELCVYVDNTIMPFQHLQQRMGVKKPTELLLSKYPVLFISYDLLYFDEHALFDAPLHERRKLLEEVAHSHSIPITNQFAVQSKQDISTLFDHALEHGNEGLMLKRKDSMYEFGQRRKSWLKVKKPSGSLDTVMLYAHAGSGKRGGSYSDFTLGVSVKDDDRYEEEFIPIGKAYSGYSDVELKKMNALIKDIILERFGPTVLLKPHLVIELEFEDIQVNKRTKAKYTLRFPRFKAIRWDLSLNDADTLKDVENMYEQKLERERRQQGINPSFYFDVDS
jgi:DNA ligase-1